MNRKHKGFTLIEILIVLVIIAVLGTIMAVVHKDAESSARANHIINNFRNLKTAALLWPDKKDLRINDHREILNYLNTKTSVNFADDTDDNNGYLFHVADGGKSLYIGFELSDDAKIKAKLTAKAYSARLLGNDMKTQYNNDSQVWVHLLSL